MRGLRVSIFDRGFLYGDGVFETMRSYGGVVFKLNEHLARLRASLRIVQIKMPYSRSFLKKEIYRMLKVDGPKDVYLRLTVTRGAGTIGLAKIDCKDPTVVIIAKEFTPYPARMYRNGVSVKLVKNRQNENSRISGIKSTSFLNYILARLDAKKAGFNDAIMLNSKDGICESTVSNIFLVKGRALSTPALEEGPLPGITRKVVLGLAARAGLISRQGHISIGELYQADEIFLTSSLMEIMPVVKADDRIIGGGRPGGISLKIHKLYRAKIF